MRILLFLAVALRLLHTADWHIGRVQMVFGGEVWDRLPDQRVALRRLVKLVDRLDPHVLLIAGDLYDVPRPRTGAEQLIAEYLPQLSCHGKRLVVVIAGNHDSRTGLTTYRSWALPHGIILLGTTKDTSFYKNKDLGQDHKVDSPAPGVLNIYLAGFSDLLQIYAFPHVYSSQWAGGYEEATGGNTYDYDKAWSQVPENYGKVDAYQVFVGHSFCVAGKGTEVPSEAPDDEVGEAFRAGPDQPHGPDLFHERLQYVALGHLHRPHQVGSHPIYYPGSLLWYGPQYHQIDRQVYLATWSDPKTPPVVESHILDLSEFRYKVLETDKIEDVKDLDPNSSSSSRRPLWLKWRGSVLLTTNDLEKLSKAYYLFYRSEVSIRESDRNATHPNEALRALIMSGDSQELLREFLRHKKFSDEDIQKAINIIFSKYADSSRKD